MVGMLMRDQESSGNAKASSAIGTMIRLLPYVFWLFTGLVAIPLLVVLIVREVRKYQEKENRIKSAKNLKQIGKPSWITTTHTATYLPRHSYCQRNDSANHP
jgi:hypothetical protein